MGIKRALTRASPPKRTEAQARAENEETMRIIAKAAATAGRASLAATKALVSTAKATKLTKGATLVPAVAPAAHVDLGGTYHSFVNLLPGALFTWDPSVDMPGIYTKWSPHLYRRLNDERVGCISEHMAGIRCYRLPEAEVLNLLKEFA